MELAATVDKIIESRLNVIEQKFDGRFDVLESLVKSLLQQTTKGDCNNNSNNNTVDHYNVNNNTTHEHENQANSNSEHETDQDEETTIKSRKKNYRFV